MIVNMIPIKFYCAAQDLKVKYLATKLVVRDIYFNLK